MKKQRICKKALVGIALGTMALAANVAVASPIVGASSGLATAGSHLLFNEVTLPQSASVGSAFSSYGVTFSGLYYDAGDGITDAWYPGGQTPYLANFVGTDTGHFGNIDIRFSSLQTGAAFTFASNGGTFNLTAYNGSTAVESLNFNGSYWGYYGFDDISFDRLSLTAPSALLIDDLQYTSSAIPTPEPGTVALVGMGLGALCLYNKRRKDPRGAA